MNKMKVELFYPVGFGVDSKELSLNEMELNALLGSKKVGSEGKYFLVDEILFEDKDENYSVTVMLKSS